MSADFSGLFATVAANMDAVRQTPYVEAIERATAAIADALAVRRRLLIFGNGGSAADALHIAAELVGRFSLERGALPAIALSSNPSILTAWSNDYSFEDVFARQVEALGDPGDVAWGISTSGNSPNVIRALETARRRGLITIGMTGRGGGAMADACDILLAVPLDSTPRIQEVHLVTYHAICGEVERRLAAAER